MRAMDEIERLEDELLDATERVEEIQSQLGDDDRTYSDGSEMTDDEFYEWRQRAKYALKCANHDKRRLAVALKRARWRQKVDSAGRVAELRSDDTLGMLLALANVARWALCHIPFDEVDPKMQSVMDFVRLTLEERHGLIVGERFGSESTEQAMEHLGGGRTYASREESR